MIKYMSNLPATDDQNQSLSGIATVPNPTAGDTATAPQITSIAKEHEPASAGETAQLEEVVSDIELEPDLESAGLEKKSEVMAVSQDIQQMGVQAVGHAQPVIPATPTVTLPISDDKVLTGLHANISSALRWLAEWCVRVLKKGHIHLKRVGGKVIRENDV